MTDIQNWEISSNGIWARGYYVSTAGNVDEETVKKYIREQQEESYMESGALR